MKFPYWRLRYSGPDRRAFAERVAFGLRRGEQMSANFIEAAFDGERQQLVNDRRLAYRRQRRAAWR